jgi:hypothetical protein
VTQPRGLSGGEGQFGQRVVHLGLIMGNYSLLAMLINSFDTDLPPSRRRCRWPRRTAVGSPVAHRRLLPLTGDHPLVFAT